MHLRRKTVRKNGKTHEYWLLVRSVRTGRRVRQEVIAQLGKLDAKGRRRARALANRMTGRRMHPSLFEPPATDDDPVETIRLKEVGLERTRRLGDVFVGLALWRALKLDQATSALMPQGREDVPWSTMAAAMVICRLCMPSSELLSAVTLRRALIVRLCRRARVTMKAQTVTLHRSLKKRDQARSRATGAVRRRARLRPAACSAAAR